jgi:hypothetical protein
VSEGISKRPGSVNDRYAVWLVDLFDGGQPMGVITDGEEPDPRYVRYCRKNAAKLRARWAERAQKVLRDLDR